MREWLTEALLSSAAETPQEAEGYVLGRGLPSRFMEEMRVGLWRCPSVRAPDGVFVDRHGASGHYVDSWLTIPLWSPRGRVIGVEFRTWKGGKKVSKYHLPESAWSPVFVGLTPSNLDRIWAGGDVWLVEGVFDLALAHVTPDGDAVLSTGGAKITSRQVAFLQRFLSPRAMVHVVFDMDETGQKMTHGYTHPETGRKVWGVLQRLERAQIQCRSLKYRGKDPGEVWSVGGARHLRAIFRL